MSVRPAVSRRRGALSWLAFRLDSSLRRRQGVFEYCRDEECLFRAQRVRARDACELSDGVSIAPGAPVLSLHVWNEHVPPIGPEGANLMWARHLSRSIDRSLRLLAEHLRDNAAAYQDVQAICADISLRSASRGRQILLASARFGFEIARTGEHQAHPLRRIGESILALILVAASNPRSLRLEVLKREHMITYLSRRRLESRYLGGGALVSDDRRRLRHG